MEQKKRVEEYEKLVVNKFSIYNSLFLNLPYTQGSNIMIMIPVLAYVCQKGLEEGMDPKEIMDSFFDNYANISSDADRIDFMFNVVRFVERQVVLFDSVEDAAFPKVEKQNTSINIRDFFDLSESNKKWHKVGDKLSNFSARIVFTSHPTQFYSPQVLDIISSLRGLILQNKLHGINQKLQQLGLTSLINSKKPTPLDEAKNIIYFLRNVYYNAVGDLYAYIKQNIHDRSFSNPEVIKLGFWPGGDRDGNPYVTWETTQRVADELRITLMKCYYHDIKRIQQKLSFKKIEVVLDELRTQLYDVMFDEDKFISYDDIIVPLQKARELLIQDYHSLYLDDLDIVIDKVKIFRTHFATLDVRQNHKIHKQVVCEILVHEGIIKESLDELSKDELVEILTTKKIDARTFDLSDPVYNDTIANIAHLKVIQTKNGEQGCNRYIISDSEDIFSVLFVYGLFRWSGWDEANITFDIVPLFETMIGMDGAEATMQELFDNPHYAAHMQRRKKRQTMMLGFSDGTKDGGFVKANWSIFKTKEILTSVCERNEMVPIFFDGRGGPPSRGGGKTHAFYASQSRHIANNEIQLTIQGQTITSTYGTKEQFMFNVEQLLTAGLSNDFFAERNDISEESRALIEEISEASYKAYVDLKNHEKFMPYLEEKSALKYYGKANVGSRPVKRGTKAKLEFSDLRAISFVGSWSQLKQNVPGYFGIGTALKQVADEGRTEDLKGLFNNVPFFKALMLNSMMSLSKCNFELTRYMEKDPEFKDFWEILYNEFVLSKDMLLKISGYKVLMQEEPVSKESIRIREDIVLPLLMIQQYGLQKISEGSHKSELYEKLVTRSLYGNINASRNSA